MGFDQIDDACGEHTRLPGPRTGKCQDGAFEMFDRSALFGVESFEMLQVLNTPLALRLVPDSGRKMSNTVPPLLRVRATMVPPCRSSMMRCVSDRPTPQPEDLVVTPGWKIRSRTDAAMPGPSSAMWIWRPPSGFGTAMMAMRPPRPASASIAFFT